MKEICTLSITPNENKVLTDLADFCDDRVGCNDCPLKGICDSCLNRTDTNFVTIAELLTDILLRVKVEEE